MPTHLTPLTLAATLTVAALATTTGAYAIGNTVGSAESNGAQCVGATIEEPAPVAEVIDTATERTQIREVNDLTRHQMRRVEADPAAWADECGRVFFVEATHPDTHATTSPLPARAVAAAPADPLTLESNPGADHTIYLDFTGGSESGTAWNWSYGEEITSPTYSINAPATTAFDEEERAHIALAWANVAEDFAPFEVNVTTKDPGTDALSRTSQEDSTYGTRVVITATNTIGDNCGCGGLAYVDVFAEIANPYQPAWVFTDGSSPYGHSMAQAISHEVGHNFGLLHDGTSQAPYFAGSNGWAPIMGVSYGQRISQWSAGEYSDANNHEDDLSQIATGAPAHTDDHGNTQASATQLGVAGADGLLETRTDQDAFTFTASGQTTLSVEGPSGLSNTDLSLRILDATGAEVATRNPTSPTATEAGLNARWLTTLPATPDTYTAVVDGVGYGNPLNPGQYSDYGSLGRYTLTLVTDAPPPPPLSVTAIHPTMSGHARVGLGDFPVVTVTGGVAPYVYSVSGLPEGLDLDPVTGELCCTVWDPIDTTVTVTVTDQQGLSVTADVRFVFTVEPTFPPVPPSPPTSPPTPPALPPTPTSPPVPPTIPPTPDEPVDNTTDDTTDGSGDAGDPAVKKTQWSTAARLPAAHTGHRYRAPIHLTGHDPHTWRTRGKLPHGLTAKIKNGRLLLTGKPSNTGTFKIVVTARSATTGDTLRRTFILRVKR